MTFVWLVVLCFALGIVSSEYEVNNDLFFGYGETLYQSMTTDNGNITFRVPSSLKQLNVLSNDIISNLGTCSVISNMETEDFIQLKFEEIAEMLGIKHIHKHRHPQKNKCVLDMVINGADNYTTRFRGEACNQEKMTGAVAAGDYDNDGFVDVFFTVFYGPSLLYRNNGDGTFTDVTMETNVGPALYGSGAGWIDIDSDGDLDLYVTTLGDTRHYLYVNQGGYFTEEAKQRGLSLELGRKLAGFTPVFGDYDRDGFLDVYTTEWIMQSGMDSESKVSAARLFRNKGLDKPGYFEDQTDFAGVNMDHMWDTFRNKYIRATHVLGGSFTDFDGDGWPELLVSADFGQSRMFWNNRNGTFAECTRDCGITGFQEAMGLGIGDFNRDGIMDYFHTAVYYNNVTCTMTTCQLGHIGNALYLGKGNRKFEDVAEKFGVQDSKWGWGAAMFDFDNDGKLDIISTNGFEVPSTTLDDHFAGKDNINLFQNKGLDTPMKDVTVETGLKFDGMGRGLIVLDFDKDGDLDVLLAANVGPPKFFKNKGGNRNNWIKIRPMHICDNNANKLCDSYGAKVHVTTPDGQTQFGEVGSDTHYLGQSEITRHFGVSRYNFVSISVYWPRFDKRTNLSNVAVKQTIRITSNFSNQEMTINSPKFEECNVLKINNITIQPKTGSVGINKDGLSVTYNTDGLTPLDVEKQYFQYSVRYGGVTKLGDVSLDLRGKPPFFIPPQCFRPTPVSQMAPSKTERRLDGRYNNENHTLWGSNEIDLIRLSPHAYADNISEPTGACTISHHLSKKCPYPKENSGIGSTRPSARTISNELFRQTKDVFSKRKLSDFTMHFGQFLVHDTDLTTPMTRFTFIQYYRNQIFLPIPVAKSDVQFDPYSNGKESIAFTRSNFNGCTGTYMFRNSPRQQVNKITAFLDANMVYGSDKKRSDYLRAFKDGRLKTGDGDLLPKNDAKLANENPVHRPGEQLFLAGDIRANVQPGLMALHVLFLREHNRLAKEYMYENPTATDEESYQHARRFVTAEFQHIVYTEYLPAILGGDHHIPKYSGYKKDVDASISTEFSTAAFRFGHSQVNRFVFRLQQDGAPIPEGHALLRDTYFKPNRLEYEGGVDPVLRGALAFPAQEVDVLMVDEMRDNLFPQDSASPGKQSGFDLAAFNIQRGRDHGIADFNSVRKALGLKAYKDFNEISSDKEVSRKLEELYEDINTVDLWVGGLAEDHVKDSELGETFHHIMVDQFTRIRDGDRFWYQNIMSEKEIEKVEKTTMSEIIKMNTLFKDCPKHVFFSSRECKKVKDHQCVSKRDPNTFSQTSTENNDVTRECENEANDNKNLELVAAVAIILAILVCLLIAFLIRTLLVSKKNKTQNA